MKEKYIMKYKENYNRKHNTSRGFTLAELLIVVAIIAVLVAVSIPIFAGQLEKSRRSVDITQARSMRTALTAALNEGYIELSDDTTIALFVSRSGINGGGYGRSDHSGIKINGGKYNGFNDVWAVLGKFGISKDIRMKQKNKNIDWYGVSINSKGECYYYEGKGKMDNFQNTSVATKYDWKDIGY